VTTWGNHVYTNSIQWFKQYYGIYFMLYKSKELSKVTSSDLFGSTLMYSLSYFPYRQNSTMFQGVVA